MINVNEATMKIKAAGANNVRVVPRPGQNVQSGEYQIEIKDGSSWQTIAVCPNRSIADSIVNQAVNKVILG